MTWLVVSVLAGLVTWTIVFLLFGKDPTDGIGDDQAHAKEVR